MKKSSSKQRQPPGPVAETVKIEGDWEEAVRDALGVQRPKEGWPKPDKPKPARKKKK